MKNSLLRILLVALALCLCSGLIACQPNDQKPNDDTKTSGKTDDTTGEPEQTTGADDTTDADETSGEPATEPPTVEAISCKLATAADFVRVIGRTRTVGTGVACDFSASGIEFNAYVEGDLKLKVTTSATSYSSTATAYFTVIVDGVRSATRFKANPGTTTLTIASFAEGGVHHVQVLKQTEAMNALCVLEELSFTGYFAEAPKNADVFIEFIGDSITSGYGNLCANGAENPGNALNQDGTQSFAYGAVSALGVDYSMVSASGVGVLAGFREFTADTLFKTASYYRDSTAYAPTRTPDIVVINLGTNDESKGVNGNNFQAKATELITLIRTTYGEDVKIVLVYDMMKSGMASYWNKAIRALGGEDAGLYMFKGTRNTGGGNGHPDLATQKKVGLDLAEFLVEKGLVEQEVPQGDVYCS